MADNGNWCEHCKAPYISMDPCMQVCITGMVDCAAECARRAAAHAPRFDLHDECVKRGWQVDSHESDLYIRDTPEARGLLAEHGLAFEPFVSASERWLDVPFAYSPFWRK